MRLNCGTFLHSVSGVTKVRQLMVSPYFFLKKLKTFSLLVIILWKSDDFF